MKKSIKELLIKYRKKYNLTQRQLGNIIFASQSQVSKWEHNCIPSNLRRESIFRIINV